MFKPKTFNYRGHRYTIFAVAESEREAQTKRSKRYGMLHRSYLTTVKQLPDGRWAAGERKG